MYYLLIHSLKYLLNAYYMSSTMLDIGYVAMSDTDAVFSQGWETWALWSEILALSTRPK